MLTNVFSDPMGTLLQILYRLPAVFIAFTIHEFMHALVAVKLGDDTPRRDGRLTLNPSAHIDWIGVIMLLIFGFGWAKPVRISPSAFKKRKLHSILVSLAGVVGNLIMAFIVFAIYILVVIPRMDGGIVSMMSGFVTALFSVNLTLTVFNLIPIPPLDGYAVVKTLVARNLTYWWNFEQYGFVVLIILSFTGVLGTIMAFATGFLLSGFYWIIYAVMGLF